MRYSTAQHSRVLSLDPLGDRTPCTTRNTVRIITTSMRRACNSSGISATFIRAFRQMHPRHEHMHALLFWTWDMALSQAQGATPPQQSVHIRASTNQYKGRNELLDGMKLSSEYT